MQVRETQLNRSKGFTLIEMLIVIAIIGVLIAVAVPVFNSQLERARKATDVANLRNLGTVTQALYLTEELEVNASWKNWFVVAVFPDQPGRVYIDQNKYSGSDADATRVYEKFKESGIDLDSMRSYSRDGEFKNGYYVYVTGFKKQGIDITQPLSVTYCYNLQTFNRDDISSFWYFDGSGAKHKSVDLSTILE